MALTFRVGEIVDPNAADGSRGYPGASLMRKQRIEIREGDQVRFGRIEDAQRGRHDDARFDVGESGARPQNERRNGAGMDVSPALSRCPGSRELDGEDDRVPWRFVVDADAPAGRRLDIVTRDR